MNPFVNLLQPIIFPFKNPIPFIREEAYKRIDPYKGYRIPDQLKDLSVKTKENLPDNIDDAEMDDLDVETADEIWAEYLKIPKSRRRFPGSRTIVDSKYAPKNGNVKKYKSLKLKESDKDLLVDYTDDLKIGQNKTSDIFANKNLGVHTIGRGVDPKRGEYRSYYDKWDLNPFNGKYGGINIPVINKAGDASLGVGNPVNIYDRLYLDDYYGVSPKQTRPKPGDYYGGYLPEVVIQNKSNYDWIMENMK